MKFKPKAPKNEPYTQAEYNSTYKQKKKASKEKDPSLFNVDERQNWLC